AGSPEGTAGSEVGAGTGAARTLQPAAGTEETGAEDAEGPGEAAARDAAGEQAADGTAAPRDARRVDADLVFSGVFASADLRSVTTKSRFLRFRCARRRNDKKK